MNQTPSQSQQMPAVSSASSNHQPGDSGPKSDIADLIFALASKTAAVWADAGDQLIATLAEKYDWPADEIEQSSPLPVPEDTTAQRDRLLSLFEPGDKVTYVRLEEHTEVSAREVVSALRQNRSEIYEMECWVTPASEVMLCPQEPRVLVIRGEALDCGDTEGAWVLRWLVEQFGMTLRAVTYDACGYCGWFSPLDDEALAGSLAYWLPTLGLCSSSCFDLRASVYVPGEKAFARLVYFAG